MNSLSIFLANPVVGAIGYILTVLSGIIAIVQTFEKNKAQKIVNNLNIEIERINQENNTSKLTSRDVEVSQGEKSQFFQQNSGTINIDNRG